MDYFAKGRQHKLAENWYVVDVRRLQKTLQVSRNNVLVKILLYC